MKKLLMITAALLLATSLSAASSEEEQPQGVHVTDVTILRSGQMVEAGFRLQVGRQVTGNNNILVVTPVLRRGEQRLPLLPVVVEGRRASVSAESRRQAAQQWPGRDPYYTSNGKTVVYRYTFPYQTWMQGAELLLEGTQLSQGGSTATEWGIVASNLLTGSSSAAETPFPVPSVAASATTPARAATTAAPVSAQPSPAPIYTQQGSSPQGSTVAVNLSALSPSAAVPSIAPSTEPPRPQSTPRPTVSAAATPAAEKPLPALPLGESTGDKWAREYAFVAPEASIRDTRTTPTGGEFDYNMPLDLGRGTTDRQQAALLRLAGGFREGALTLQFGQARRTIDRELEDNNKALVDLIMAIRALAESRDSRITQVVVAGFASPEGTQSQNDRLAGDRAAAVREFIINNSPIDPSVVHAVNGGIDWDGLRQLVVASDMPEKGRVLRILDETPVWDSARNIGRHGELMRLSGGSPYNYMLRYFFPQLRQAAYIKVYYENR